MPRPLRQFYTRSVTGIIESLWMSGWLVPSAIEVDNPKSRTAESDKIRPCAYQKANAGFARGGQTQPFLARVCWNLGHRFQTKHVAILFHVLKGNRSHSSHRLVVFRENWTGKVRLCADRHSLHHSPAVWQNGRPMLARGSAVECSCELLYQHAPGTFSLFQLSLY